MSFSENGLIRTIIEKVLMNAQGKLPQVSATVLLISFGGFHSRPYLCLYLLDILSQYVWINPAATEPQRASGPKRRAAPGAVRGKAPLKIGMWAFLCFFFFFPPHHCVTLSTDPVYVTEQLRSLHHLLGKAFHK